MSSRYSPLTVWKSRDAFEKSTFFKRLKLQGFPGLEEFWAILESGALRNQRILRLNDIRNAQLEDFTSEGFLIGEELAAFPRVYNFDLSANALRSQHALWGTGRAYVQDRVALEIVEALEIKSGDSILDLCAAPGGKSTRIAEKLGSTGWLVANDSELKRARILSGNLIRHGALRTSVFSKDGAQLCSLFPESFDKILLDAPCSGESMFFKREERRRDVYESEVQDLVRLQTTLMASAAKALRPGGRLVYSTCTYNLSENEENVKRFLKQHSDFQLRKEERRWPHTDKTAGGYWAVLEKKGQITSPSGKMLRHADCERHALLDRDGKINPYARSMLCENIETNSEENFFTHPPENFEDWILMTNEEAQAYLGGEAIPNPSRKQGLHRILFKGKWPLGAAKGVENRFNNLLPVEARTQFRNL